MIAQHKVEQVRYLLSQGVSQRKIARIVGISRGTVVAIAHGKRRDAPEPDELDGWPAHGEPRRCPGCGGMVYLPCRLCHVRSLNSFQRRLAQRRKRWRRLLQQNGSA